MEMNRMESIQESAAIVANKLIHWIEQKPECVQSILIGILCLLFGIVAILFAISLLIYSIYLGIQSLFETVLFFFIHHHHS